MVAPSGTVAVDPGASASPMPSRAPPRAPGPTPGTRIADRYEVVRELGRGGFGVVLEARDALLGRPVALKLLLAGDGEERASAPAAAEAEAVSRLSHPNIVQIHDRGDGASGPFLVLELLEGESLARRIGRGPLGLAEAVRVALAAARGVAHAHVRGVVHRDLKPANVFLCSDGGVKVLDFGLAHLVHRSGRHQGGTPGWMAPEQARGEPGDERTDVWALGAILARAIAGEAASGRLSIPGASDLEALVESMLAPEPDARPRDASRVVEALEAISRRLAETARASSGRARKKATTSRPPSPSLPRSLTPLVGREEDVRALSAAVAASPLVTVTGPGGTGKTRVAIAVAEAVPRSVARRVAFVDVAALAEPAMVARAAAVALQLRDLPHDARITDAIAAALRDESVLLVVDNCEHLVEACATLVSALLAGCRGVRILTTSQLPLGIGGEVVYRLAPLTAPPVEPAPAGTDLAEWRARYPALELLVQRLRAVDPGFELTPARVPHAAEICRRLEGLPLALELVAPRVRVLSIAEIAQQLGERFELLGKGDRNAPTRQQGLGAVLEWSYGLLSPAERSALERLSVFAGTFSQLAAATVLAPLAPGRAAVVELLQGLVDKSLVFVQQSGDDARRFRLLETVRQYARARLADSGEEVDARSRLLEWAIAIAEAEGRPGRAWHESVAVDYLNLRVAFEFAREREERALDGLRLAAGIWMYWLFRGQTSEIRSWIELGLRRAPGAPAALRAEAIAGLSILNAFTLAEPEPVRATVEAGLPLVRELEDARLEAILRYALFLAELGADRPEVASTSAEEALRCALRSGVGWVIALSLQARSACASKAGDCALALRAIRESLEHREEGAPRLLSAYLHLNLGLQSVANGDWDGARRAFRAVLDDPAAGSVRRAAAGAFEGAAYVGSAHGACTDSVRLLAAAARLREVTAHPLHPQWARTHAQAEARMRAALGDVFEREWKAGATLPFEEAIALAYSVLG